METDCKRVRMGESLDKKTKSESGAGTRESLFSLNAWCYYVSASFVKLLSYLPLNVLYAMSDVLYYPFYYVVRYRRKVVRKNLTESFPDKSLDEIVQIEKKFYHFFIDMILETCKLISISEEEMRRRLMFTNAEVLHKMLAEGKSVSVFLGHYGNWEWISSSSLWFKEVTIAQIYHTLTNKAMNKIMKRLRERMGSVCVDRYETVRFMATAAANNKQLIVGFLADQSPKSRESKHYIRFLNHTVPVLIGTEKATKHYGYEALFIDIKRVKRGYYECELTPLADYPQSLQDYELTHLYFQRLESEIRERPELYLWTHNRFKYAHA